MKFIKEIATACTLFIAVTTAMAQLPSSGISESGVLDGVYIQEHVPTKKIISYTHLREADVIWSKRVWRTIDLREKANFHLYYPEEPISDRRSLWDIIKYGIEVEGSITPYHPGPGLEFDDQFKYPVKPPNGNINDEAYKRKLTELLYNVDVVQRRDDEDEPMFDAFGDPIYDSVTQPLSATDIVAYYVKEDWFFDKQKSQLEVRIIGIAPVVYKYDASGENIRAKQELFWIYFPECRYVFQNYFSYNRQNDARRYSFDDVFWKRQFTSYIHKESNIYDRQIFPTWQGLDALHESERIKQEMFEFEHDLWHL